MLSNRTIITLFLAIAMVLSLMPAMTVAAPAAQHTNRSCCSKDDHSSTPQKTDCTGGSCAMPCCQVVTALPDATPQLSAHFVIVSISILPPITPHSSINPEALFHPPRFATISV